MCWRASVQASDILEYGQNGFRVWHRSEKLGLELGNTQEIGLTI
jgi:hypothetical protein